MLYLEELVDAVLSEEGQTLMGLSFLVDALGLSMKKIEVLFKKSALEYSRRKPIKETRIFTGNPIVMPEGTLSVRAVRYGVLPELPKFYMTTFGDISYEYDRYTRILKIWPPIYPMRVTYNRIVNITKDRTVTGSTLVPSGEDTIFMEVPCSPADNTITIVKGDKVMTQTGKCEREVSGYLGEETQNIINLSGTLGTGTLNLNTRELELDLEDTTEGALIYTYKPLYSAIDELDLGDYVFTKLFASKLLEALASLRAQATQDVLHNIDLTTDNLYARVRELKRELRTLLRETISFSSMAPI